MSYVTQIWDDELARLAASWASGCVFEHEQPSIAMNPAGQNIFAQHDGSQLNLASATQLWYDEVNDYNYDSKACRSGAHCDHYTQVTSVTLS